VADAFAGLSARSGCIANYVTLDEGRAAIDVDTVDDWRLAERILAD
jgi:GTP:adenosylcobinamide-phosphate guanylyltransferase